MTLPPRPPRRRPSAPPPRPAAAAPPVKVQSMPQAPLRMPAPHSAATQTHSAAMQVESPHSPAPAMIGATTATRLLAYTIDFVAVASGAGIAWLVTGKVGYGALIGLELIIGFWALEATRGLTLGNWVLRLRTLRSESPLPAGLMRTTAKFMMLGAGLLAAVIGSWGVVATTGLDAQRRRGWHDKAGRSVTVRLNAQSASRAAAASRASTRLALDPTPNAAVPLAIPPRPAAPPANAPLPARVPSRRGSAPPSITATGTLTPQAMARGIAQAPVPPTPAHSAVQVQHQQRLLLSFDNGQRLQMTTPGVAVLGRRPSVRAVGEQQITIDDQSGTVSKEHLELTVEADHIWATDLDSTNGSELIDDEGVSTLLVPGQRTEVETGARIALGDRTFSIAVVRG